jgi:hypothetical protein
VIRGRRITPTDVKAIQELLAEKPGLGRWRLALELCQRWQWQAANGEWKSRSAFAVLVELGRRGWIELPASVRSVAIRRVPRPQAQRGPGESIEGPLNCHRPLRWELARTFEQRQQWRQVLEAYHYLGAPTLVGANLKYLVYGPGGHLLGVFGWQSAVAHLGCRARALDWITCGCSFGNNEESLNSLPKDRYYLAEIACKRKVWVQETGISEKLKTEGCTVEQLLNVKHLLNWKIHKISEGEKGPLVAAFARVRVYLSAQRTPESERWLLLRNDANHKIKYALSNAPADTSMKDCVASLMTGLCLVAQNDFRIEEVRRGAGNQIELHFAVDPSSYYRLLQGDRVTTITTPAAVGLTGSLSVAAPAQARFFRVQQIPRSAALVLDSISANMTRWHPRPRKRSVGRSKRRSQESGLTDGLT